MAVVDLGTNSTRLLVAEVAGGSLRELERRTTVTRLGEGVDRSGRLADAAIERVESALRDYRTVMDELKAEVTVAVATSAVRDAANGDEFLRVLEERHGLRARILSGDDEALLTFTGATSGRAGGRGPLLVLDIGGGSTEFVVGRAGSAPDFHTSTQAGAVRQTERHLPEDPPAPEQLAELTLEVREIVEASVPAGLRTEVDQGVAVAGTATSLAAIDQALDPYDPSRVHGYRLERLACERMLERLASLPLEERRQVPGLHPDRAPTIVAGAVILVEAMRAFSLDSFETSEWDILHGCALAAVSPAAESTDIR